MFVLVAPGRFANKHHARLGIAIGKNEALGGKPQIAALEAGHGLAQLIERCRGGGKFTRAGHRLFARHGRIGERCRHIGGDGAALGQRSLGWRRCASGSLGGRGWLFRRLREMVHRDVAKRHIDAILHVPVQQLQRIVNRFVLLAVGVQGF